jgi:hypothetical protein
MSCDPLDCGCGQTLFSYRSDDLLFTSTQSYTASCPEGYEGSNVTRSATRTSVISQAAADALALAAATDEAIAALECTLIPPPPGCCLYPAAALGSLYQFEDLPDNIVIDGDVVPKEEIPEPGYSNGSWNLFAFGGDQWQLTNSTTPEEPTQYFDCLINPGIIADQFPPTLSFPWSYGRTYEMTKFDEIGNPTPCSWNYYSPSGCPDEFETTEPVSSASIVWDEVDCKWKMTVTFWEGNSTAGDCFLTDYITSAPKDSGTQSSPAGTYGGIVVS